MAAKSIKTKATEMISLSRIIKKPKEKDPQTLPPNGPAGRTRRGVSSQEKEILNRQSNAQKRSLSYHHLYRYASWSDRIFLGIGSISCIAAGVARIAPLIIIGQVSGEITELFARKITPASLRDFVDRSATYLVYAALGAWVALTIGVTIFVSAGHRIARRTRERYLEAVLRQNMGFIDVIEHSEVANHITSDMFLIQKAISEKVALTIISTTTFTATLVVVLVRFWKLGLIAMTSVAMIVAISTLGGRRARKQLGPALLANAAAAKVVKEAIKSIRNVKSLGIQETQMRLYDTQLDKAKSGRSTAVIAAGIISGSSFGIIILNYALVLWAGSIFLVDGQVDLGRVVSILFASILGTLSITTIVPHISAFRTGITAATEVFHVIDRKSTIDPQSNSGLKPDSFEGAIEFRDVKLIYPAKPTKVAITKLNLLFRPKTVTAIVGDTGSGKSSILNLIQRFYLPVSGNITVDGFNIENLNLRWLRQQMSLVSADPCLVKNATIHDNIRNGLVGTRFESATEEMQLRLIINAAKIAKAHESIVSLPDGYATMVGNKKHLLTPKLEQKIAMSRAIIKEPQILLLDIVGYSENPKSEAEMKETLDAISQGRTTVIITNHMPILRDADNIIYMAKGRIVEQGRHEELIERKGLYYQLVEMQKTRETQESTIYTGTTTSAVSTTVSTNKPILQLDIPSPISVFRRRGTDIVTPLTAQSYIPALHQPLSPASQPSFNSWSMSPAPLILRNKTVKTKPTPDFRRMASKRQKKRVISQLTIMMREADGGISLGMEPKEHQRRYSIWELIRMVSSFNNKIDTRIMYLGILSRMIGSCGMPVSMIFLAKSVQALALPAAKHSELRQDINFWTGMILLVAFIVFGCQLLSIWAFGRYSAGLVQASRHQTFKTLLEQDIPFFEKNPGQNLSTFLRTRTQSLIGVSGSGWGVHLSAVVIVIMALSVAITVGYKLGLVMASVSPVIIGCALLQKLMIARLQAHGKEIYEKSGIHACEMTAQTRMISSGNLDVHVTKNYHDMLFMNPKEEFRSIVIKAAAYASSQAVPLLVLALGFWYGTTLVLSGEYDLFQFFGSYTVILVAARSAGAMIRRAPSFFKGRQAALELKQLFDHQSEDDPKAQVRKSIQQIRGTRPGQFVAFLGASKSGKSTIFSLLQRFYEPTEGTILIDNHDIFRINPKQCRLLLSIVSQEPALFDGTIRDNIALARALPDSVIEEVCREVNLHDFIQSFPDGFSTVVGSNGLCLSATQSQRIAIARALIGNQPLLLDEALDNLDADSVTQIIETLREMQQRGRTIILMSRQPLVARYGEIIHVLDRGSIVETGSHDLLMGLQGLYSRLIKSAELTSSL